MPQKLAGRTSCRPDDLDRLIEKQRREIPGFDEMLAEEHANLDVAQKIYDLRTAAGLTHAKLAKLIGMKPSAVARLEFADYDGHFLAMLRRVAAALDLRVEIRCVPIRRRRKVA